MWRRLVGGFVYGSLLLGAIAAGTGYRLLSESKVASALADKVIHHTSPNEVFHSNTTTLLLLGCDEDLAPGGKKVLRKQARSDMMLVAKLDFDNKRITGLSIPRDTECRLPGDRIRKINAYHAIAKPGEEAELTKTAVEHLLKGVRIDRVVTLDYDAFQTVVNMVGGVPVEVDRTMDYDDNAGNLHIHLKPGRAVLDGYNAMCYVRYRHGDSDFKRQDRQKAFLVAFKNAVLGKPGMIGQVADQSMAVLGNALNADEIASLALFAKDVPPANIQMGQVPVVEGKGTRLSVNDKQLPSVLAQYFLTDSYGSRVSVAR
ncbi:Transcriptional regulator [Fimbriimonas ginsengisoli Gsoil 348]|uniref:Transcriptional regulator n=2 Tax=Fimbriimonas ginsengisoli TaxID=1005039 RepID=A0A068NW97_FIMGI|nr:Transcriptional regulator [Fimbriimonas ginsengisoli Gsoil 348]